MLNFIEKLVYLFKYPRQKDKQKKLKTVFTGKNSKFIVGQGANVTINSQAKREIEEVCAGVKAIVKQTNADPSKLLEYIKAANTPVFRINNADKLLRFISEEEGLICEQRGWKAFYLSIITGNYFGFKTDPMFILREGIIEKYIFLHHFYRWYALKSGLPGFDYDSQKKFKKYLIYNSNSDTKKLNMQDILDIEEAIARDQEATEFVLKYSKEQDGSKNVMEKIKNDGSANI